VQTKDLEILQSLKQSLGGNPQQMPIETIPHKISNPAQEVEQSLVRFLKHRLDKLRETSEFEDTIKEALVARIAEADFRDLATILDIVQRNNNSATEKILAPFIAQNGAPSPLLPAQDTAKKNADVDELLAGQDEKKVLQALSALNQLMHAATKVMPVDSPTAAE